MRNAFTDSEGRFQFEGLPEGQLLLTAQKPGYFTREQENSGSPIHHVYVGPSLGAQTIKLVPQAAIFGRVTDASGQPIEHIALRLSARSLRQGRKYWEQRGMSESDEDGHFRFANLMPGNYCLSVGPSQMEGQILAAGEKPTSGFPHLYYPGVPDLASAAPIQLSPGQQAEADFSLAPVPVYHVSGTISGQVADQGVGLALSTLSGDELSLPTHFNSQLGTFNLDAVPAGSYLIKVFAQQGLQPLRAEMRVNVASNLENLHLALAPAVSIPIIVHLQPGASSGSNSSSRTEDRPPISVALLPSQPSAAEAFSTFEQRSPGHNVMVIQNVDPGGYTADLRPQPPWYVQSATYGQANLLYDDISVVSGQSYPMDIVLRDDSASLTANVRWPDNAAQQRATLIIVPQPASKLRPRVVQGVSNTFTETGLAPGEYLVFAFDQLAALEYANPEALEPYASQAARVTLSANQKAQVTLDLIHLAQGE